MNLPTSIVLSGLFIALGIYCSSPRYQYFPVTTSSNPAIWKLDMHSGDVALCATGAGKDKDGKDTESGCGGKFKQY